MTERRYKTITECRICGGKTLDVLMDLGEQALNGVFPERPGEMKKGPTTLVKCREPAGCGLVQLGQTYNLDLMYGENYGYRSGLNKSMISHLSSKVAAIEAFLPLKPSDLVVDIGSNDATTLKAYSQKELKLVGVDPSGAKFANYYPRHISLVADFFPSSKLNKIIGSQKARVVTSFSMFYDLENPVSFAHAVRGLLDVDGIWVFEQSYLPSMLSANSFDTVCQEHLEYYALRQIVHILDKTDLKLIDVEFNDVNGGSFSVTAARQDSSHVPNRRSILEAMRSEDAIALGTERPYLRFRESVKLQKGKLVSFLQRARENGETVMGLGASTKGNVLLQHFEIDSEILSAIGEVNQDKIGRFTPGSDIPIIAEDEVLKKRPDYILVLPWHFRQFFCKSPKFRGLKLVFPLPEFEIVEL